jgi:ABC-type transport system involved in cytochrome c biogenesis permease subunit
MKNWKQWAPLALFAIFAAWILGSFRLPKEKDLQSHAFGRIPLVEKGRHQPFDSFARNALMQIREKQTVNLEPWKGFWDNFSNRPKIISATDWAMELAFKPEVGDTRPVFRIDNPDVKSLFALTIEASKEKQTDAKHFSWNDLKPHLGAFKSEARRAFGVKTELRGAYEKSLVELWNAIGAYKQVKFAFGPCATGEFGQGLVDYLAKVREGRTAFQAQMGNETYDAAALDWLNDQFNTPLVVPPHHANAGEHDEWVKTLQEAVAIEQGHPPHFSLVAFADAAKAYRAGDAEGVRKAADNYLNLLAPTAQKKDVKKAASEQRFNHIEPFYKGMFLCVLAFLLALMFWISPTKFGWARKTAVWLMVLTLILHASGQIFRMVHEGRPPVTNLYSSAIFIGLAAVIFGLLLEWVFPQGIGIIVASAVDFCALLIAHHLARGGDTMIMLQAVLDTNFWLATHVVIVSLGYAATFVAGFLGIMWVTSGAFSNRLAEPTGESGRPLGKVLTSMTYAIICFATLFSFVGTVLGGIWADQSWGRFWGWDVKENGALMIVLWNAIVLHARWGGIAKERGIACLAIGGNIVTAWSWFGVNMLGIGLHSYGFMGAAFIALIAFIASQVGLIILGATACNPESVPRGPAGTSSAPKSEPVLA